MFKLFFELLTEPLGLPIEWYYEWLILAIIGSIVYVIAYKIVGYMYREDYIDGKTLGSFFHWLIRLVLFVISWAVTYGVIRVGKLVIKYWQEILVGFGILTVVAILIAISIFFIKKYRKSKAVSDNTWDKSI